MLEVEEMIFQPRQNILSANGAVSINYRGKHLLLHFVSRPWIVCRRAEIAEVLYDKDRPASIVRLMLSSRGCEELDIVARPSGGQSQSKPSSALATCSRRRRVEGAIARRLRQGLTGPIARPQGCFYQDRTTRTIIMLCRERPTDLAHPYCRSQCQPSQPQ
jgi:hypothetical protein